MRWLLAFPLIPLLLCGGMCAGGALVALVIGRRAARSDIRVDEEGEGT